MCVFACIYVCICVCMCVCMCVYAGVCEYATVDYFVHLSAMHTPLR